MHLLKFLPVTGMQQMAQNQRKMFCSHMSSVVEGNFMKGISGQCCGSGREAHADVVVLFYFLMRQKHRWDLLLIHTHSGADKRVIKKKTTYLHIHSGGWRQNHSDCSIFSLISSSVDKRLKIKQTIHNFTTHMKN